MNEGPAAGLADSGLADFCRLPRWRHGAGIALVFLLLAVFFAGALSAPQPIEDEEVYAAAFARVQQGLSPYGEPQFYYLPPFAWAGAWLETHLGQPMTLVLLRTANFLAMAALLWAATAPWQLSWRARVVLAGGFGAISPAVELALAWGNLSPLAIAGWTATFWLWRRRPLWAGVSFAAAMLVKPVAAIALGLLALHRPKVEGFGKAVRVGPQLLAAAWAALLLAAALAAAPFLRDFFSLSAGIPVAARSASLQRLLYCFGITVPALALTVGVAVFALLLLRRRPRSPLELYLFAGIAGLLATPLVWSHTLLLVLPLQSAALALAYRRYREGGRALELLAVGTLALALQLSNGLGGIETWPLPLQGLFVALPCLAPLALGLYYSAERLRADRPAPNPPARP